MSKFYTTSSSLFTNKNETQIPDWLESLSVMEINTNKKNLNLEFEKRGSFQDKTVVKRPLVEAAPRQLENNINDKVFEINAKIDLSKFLIGKYYKTNTRIAGNKLYLDTVVDDLQANFSFIYENKNNKIVKSSTFLINEVEYPFSQAGFKEALVDLKTGNVKQTQHKIASSNKTYIINREDIVRRYNNSLRLATDAINEQLREGNIVGVGSNAYASYINPDELFPYMEKEKPQEVSGSFDFVKNKEHVASKEVKSARKLSIDASKILSNIFVDFIINSNIRDNNELLVNATILNSKNGKRYNINFNFDIDNEKLSKLKLAEIDDKRMSIKQLLDYLNMDKNNLINKYLNKSVVTNKIYNGYIFSERDIKNKLNSIVSADNISKIIETWINSGSIKPINSTTFTSDKSFEELLDLIVIEILSDEEIQNIQNYKKHFGDGLDINRIEEKDTGVRYEQDIEANKEYKLFKINSLLSKKLKNYYVVNFDNDNNSVEICLNSSGIRHNIKLNAKFNNRKLLKVNAIINDKEVPLSKLTSAFSYNKVLNNYLRNNKSNDYSSSILESKKNLLLRLSNLVKNPEETLNDWEDKKYLTKISDTVYTSKYSFEELLLNTNSKVLSEEDIEQIAEAKKHFGKTIVSCHIKDNDTREMTVNANEQNILYLCNNFIDKHFNNFKPVKFNLSSDKLTVNYMINLFDELSGISSDIDLTLKINNGVITDCYSIINEECISLDNIKKSFAINDILSKYLQFNNGKKVNSSTIISKKGLLSKLSKITNATEDEINAVINQWNNLGKIQYLDSNTIASKLTLEQLISMSNIKPLSDDEITRRLDKSRRDKLLSIKSNHIKNNDTRVLEDTWSAEQQTLHVKSEIGSMFKDFDIINVEMDDDNYKVTARVVNPITGLKKCLMFNFDTENNTKLGKISVVSDGEIETDTKNIISLLKCKDNVVNKFISLNNVKDANCKKIISKNNLKSRLVGIIDFKEYDNILLYLNENEIIKSLDNNNFISEYSITEILQYLDKNQKIDIEDAENKLNTYGKDIVVDTDVEHVKDCDSRKLEKKEEKLSPAMINAANKIEKIINGSFNSNKITIRKKEELLAELKTAKNPNNIEAIWRKLKIYL